MSGSFVGGLNVKPEQKGFVGSGIINRCDYKQMYLRLTLDLGFGFGGCYDESIARRFEHTGIETILDPAWLDEQRRVGNIVRETGLPPRE